MQNLLLRGSQGDDLKRLKTLLAQQLGVDAQRFGNLGQGNRIDAETEAAARCWQAGVGLVADGVIGPHCQRVLGLREAGALALDLNLAAVRQLFPATKPANISRYLPYVAAALAALGLNDRAMICAALATIRAESEGFLPISELQSQLNTLPGGAPFGAYESPKNKKLLGNSESGDGARFKGRGFVRLTGRANYARYGQALAVDLLAKPDLALAPEIAALLLAQVLAEHADAMRTHLAKGNFAAARELVNSGTHGLDQFREVFKLAEAVWPAAAKAPKSATTGPSRTRGQAASATAAKRVLNVRKDPPDLNDRPYQPPPVGLLEAFPGYADLAKWLPKYSKAGLVLDQGEEGACTGFGLACVVNYLRWSKAGFPDKMESVSPRMFYNFARRYDEYAGEGYEGSSCRGALRGWFNHGVCLESDWPYSDSQIIQPRYGYANRASGHTLGVYYRIDLRCITDMQAAIQSVGAIFVSAFTHAGWQAVPTKAKAKSRHQGHHDLPLIAFDGRPSKIDGHAFAMVGFNSDGFVIQNSWGEKFGMGGFAVLSYADWLTNGLDAWVAAMGVPGVVGGRVSSYIGPGRALAGRTDTSAWWSEDRAYQHSLVFGNDGRMKRYLTEDELSRTLLHQVAGLPDQWFRTRPATEKKRLVIYAHGGLNSEDAAIQRARAMGRHFLGNYCYPLFIVWKTGLLESIGSIAADEFRKQPVLAGGIGEWVSEKTDLLIEKTIGRPLARPIWSEMKENAELAFGSGRGGDLLITALQKLHDSWGDQLEIHLVGHSAGSIVLGHLLSALTSRRMDDKIASIHLYAPACTVQFANRHYAPHAELMKRLYLHVLSNEVERNDNVAAIYRKSLLYFVSNALEVDLRTPILGLDNVTDQDYRGWDGTSSTGESLKAWRQAAAKAGLVPGDRYAVVGKSKVLTAQPDKLIDAAHGSFDNDVDVLGTTLARIRGGKLRAEVDDLRGF